jgi:hypothetical protein
VDAHVKFAKAWDARLITEWASLGSEYAMLTTYTMPYENIDERDQIPHICKCVWLKSRSWQLLHKRARRLGGIPSVGPTSANFGALLSDAGCGSKSAAPPTSR